MNEQAQVWLEDFDPGCPVCDPDQLKELAAAFTKLMSTDTSNAQKVVNRLRKIYKKPITNA